MMAAFSFLGEQYLFLVNSKKIEDSSVICTAKQLKHKEHLLCSIIRRYRKCYFCILVVGSKVIQNIFFFVKW